MRRPRFSPHPVEATPRCVGPRRAPQPPSPRRSGSAGPTAARLAQPGAPTGGSSRRRRPSERRSPDAMAKSLQARGRTLAVSTWRSSAAGTDSPPSRRRSRGPRPAAARRWRSSPSRPTPRMASPPCLPPSPSSSASSPRDTMVQAGDVHGLHPVEGFRRVEQASVCVRSSSLHGGTGDPRGGQGGGVAATLESRQRDPPAVQGERLRPIPHLQSDLHQGARRSHLGMAAPGLDRSLQQSDPCLHRFRRAPTRREAVVDQLHLKGPRLIPRGGRFPLGPRRRAPGG